MKSSESIFLETKRLRLKTPELTDLDELVAFIEGPNAGKTVGKEDVKKKNKPKKKK